MNSSVDRYLELCKLIRDLNLSESILNDMLDEMDYLLMQISKEEIVENDLI